MSTRATYEFRIDGECPAHDPITFYVHYDGYPTGAAEKFAAALAFKPEAPNSNFADCFYRANRAEFTRGHSAHGDTEYRYDVTQTGEWRDYGNGRGGRKPLRIVARSVDGFGYEPRPTTVIFDGLLSEFIQQAEAIEAKQNA